MNEGRRRWWVLVIAGAAAVAGVLIAPEQWTEGRATLEVVAAETEMEVPVVVGSEAAIEYVDPSTGIVVELPEGVPIDQTITVVIAMPPDASTPNATGSPERELDVTQTSVALVRADGFDEKVPVVSSEGSRLVATRQPPDGAAVVLGLLGLVVVLWVTEFFPLFVTSLAIPVVLAVSGVATAGEALAPFFDPIIVLFFAGFLMAIAMRRVDLDRWVAVAIVARARGGPAGLFASLVVLSALLSMFMSNTAAVAVLVPVTIAVTAPLNHPGFRRAAVLAIAYSATIGGVGSAIGTPANQLAIKYLDDLTGTSISFTEWFAFGLPMVVLFLPLMAAYLWFTGDVRVDRAGFDKTREEAKSERADAGRFSGPQLHVLLVFVAVFVLWVAQPLHEVSTGIVALGGAVVLFMTGRLEPGDVGAVSWPTLLTFGGGLTLGIAMTASGSADWIVAELDGLEVMPTFIAVAVVALVALLMTTVASNTAAAAMLIPLAVPLAGLIGVSPTMLVIVVAIATSVDFALVIGTPPTMLAYETGLYTAGRIFRKGVVLDLVGIALLVTVVPLIWNAMGIV